MLSSFAKFPFFPFNLASNLSLPRKYKSFNLGPGDSRLLEPRDWFPMEMRFPREDFPLMLNGLFSDSQNPLLNLFFR